jgi:pimeloyl-ACP methyl ester carboxylesterase
MAFLRASGVTKVFLIGASLGGHTVLWTASLPNEKIAGVVSLSAPRPGAVPEYDLTADVLRRITAPKLFVAGDREEQFADDAQAMYDLASDPKQLVLLPSDRHGAELVTSSGSLVGRATAVILDFLAANR